MTIKQNTFAAACYDQNSIEDLIDALASMSADKADCKAWGITPTEWRSEIAAALQAKVDDLRERIGDGD